MAGVDLEFDARAAVELVREREVAAAVGVGLDSCRGALVSSSFV